MVETGGLSTFNIQHGYVEALVRGMRNSFVSDSDYHHLTQCDTLEDCKLNLTESDYGASLQNDSTLTPQDLQKAAVDKLAVEFQYLRSQAVAPLAQFLDFITHEYMIEVRREGMLRCENRTTFAKTGRRLRKQDDVCENRTTFAPAP